MSRPWLWLVLGLAGVISFVADDFMNEAIVAPTLYFFWVGRLVLASIPQGVLWGIFLIVAVIVTWQSVVRKPSRSGRGPISRPQPSGRIAEWLRLVERSEQETYYKWQLAQRLQKLTLKALAHNERVSLRLIRQRLSNDKLGLPSEIQAYFLASIASFGNFTTIAKFKLFRPPPPPTPLDLEPEKIAQFLEEKFNL